MRSQRDLIRHKKPTAKTLLFVVNVDWFFISHRLPIAVEAARSGYEVHVATVMTDKWVDLAAHGFTLHALEFKRGDAGLISAWSTFRQLYRVFKELNPDLVHLVTIKPVLLGGLAARLARVPAVVAAVSGLGYVFLAQGFKARVQRWIAGVVYRLALAQDNAMVIFQNVDDRDRVSRLAKLPAERSLIIRGSGVDLADYHLTPHPPGPPIVMLAARLLADKGIREFVEAARILRRSNIEGHSKVRFVLVGSVDPANPTSLTQEELRAWSDEGCVELWGFREDMPKVLAEAFVVVLPSYREGLPKILIEAAACGRAVVTTDVPGCRDAIESGITGLLAPPRDAIALSRVIGELIEDPERCRVMGIAGRQLAERAFDLRRVVSVHMQLYASLVGRTQ